MRELFQSRRRRESSQHYPPRQRRQRSRRDASHQTQSVRSRSSSRQSTATMTELLSTSSYKTVPSVVVHHGPLSVVSSDDDYSWVSGAPSRMSADLVTEDRPQPTATMRGGKAVKKLLEGKYDPEQSLFDVLVVVTMFGTHTHPLFHL